MCGVFGFSLKQEAAINLEAVASIIEHRGPDGKGFYYSDNNRVGLGHVRLAIIGLGDHGAQPYISKDQKSALSYNGEIYNFKSIAENLTQEGIYVDDHSDTNVLFEFLLRYGLTRLYKLNGMFAFAFYN